MYRCCALLFCLLMVVAPAYASTWRDITGKYSVEAEFVTMAENIVQLRRADGKVKKDWVNMLCNHHLHSEALDCRPDVDPLRYEDFAQRGFAKATVSGHFKKEFGSHDAYVKMCEAVQSDFENEDLVRVLERLCPELGRSRQEKRRSSKLASTGCRPRQFPAGRGPGERNRDEE